LRGVTNGLPSRVTSAPGGSGHATPEEVGALFITIDPSSSAGANKSPRWRRAIRFPRSIRFASMSENAKATDPFQLSGVLRTRYARDEPFSP
jgi:hypothetical protein